jgi:ribosome-binding protein aMBF1 (putative translation factor)
MQTITTPGGERLVMMSLAEYEKLVDLADIARGNKVKADIAAGRDELVPDDVAKRLVKGASPVRVWREHRGMSVRDLASAAGLSAPYVSEIETGKKEGSISAMKKVAEALEVDLADLV